MMGLGADSCSLVSLGFAARFFELLYVAVSSSCRTRYLAADQRPLRQHDRSGSLLGRLHIDSALILRSSSL